MLYIFVCVTTISPFLQFQEGFGRKKKKKEVRRYVTLSNIALYLSHLTFTLLLTHYIKYMNMQTYAHTSQDIYTYA